MKQICPFDKTHIMQSVQQLRNHILKCKSQNKLNFQQCKFNSDHWVNFSKIKQHQQQCKLNKNLTKSALSFVQSCDDSVLHQMVEALDDSRLNNVQYQLSLMVKKQQEERDMAMKKKNRRKNKNKQQEKQQKLWQEPSFKKWAIKNYTEKKNSSNYENSLLDKNNSIDIFYHY